MRHSAVLMSRLNLRSSADVSISERRTPGVRSETTARVARVRAVEVASLTFDLFCELNATDEQLDFPIVYASGRNGYATLDLDEPSSDMKPLL